MKIYNQIFRYCRLLVTIQLPGDIVLDQIFVLLKLFIEFQKHKHVLNTIMRFTDPDENCLTVMSVNNGEKWKIK